MYTFTRQVTIEFGQCDPAGICYYPNYFDMFNTSTEGLICAALEVHPRALSHTYDFFGIPMVDARNVYHRPSRHGDRVSITSQVARLGGSSFDIRHALITDGGELGVEGFETRVWAITDPDNESALKGRRIPDLVRSRLSQA